MFQKKSEWREAECYKGFLFVNTDQGKTKPEEKKIKSQTHWVVYAPNNQLGKLIKTI